MEIRTCGPVAEVQVDEKLRITRAWQKISRAKAKPLVGSEYKGRPLYEIRDTKSTRAADKPAPVFIEEIDQGPSEEATTEDDS